MSRRTITRSRRDNPLRMLTPAATGAAETMSWRDALDRAEQITNPSEAIGLLRLADYSGDPDLGRAVAIRAAEESRRATPAALAWRAVLATWADRDHDGAALLVDLDALPGGDAA